MDICRFSGSPVFAPGTSDLLVGAAVYIYDAGTTTPATVYQDYTATTPHTFPIVVDSSGLLPAIYWGEGTFRVRVNVSASDNTPVWDFDGIKGEIIPVVSGGGGTTPPDAELKKTGDLQVRFEDGDLTGYVRANGRTIGSSTSGATERANADTEALFSYGWNKWSDTVAPVVGGRGANAASDWSANKQLTLPNARGAALVGLDTMGNAAANALQATTTITTTNASTSATIGSAANVAVGMYIAASGVPSGTYITDMDGLTITMSNAATATATGATARFSPMTDAQVPAARGGHASRVTTVSELPADPLPHTHNKSYSTRGTILPDGNVHSVVMSTNVGNQQTWFTGTDANTGNLGKGAAHSLVQPSIGVTIYIKL